VTLPTGAGEDQRQRSGGFGVSAYPHDWMRRASAHVGLAVFAGCAALAIVAVVPALASQVAVPTKYMCAGEWNRSAPRSVLAWERRQHVWQATVQSAIADTSTFSWSKGKPVTSTPARPIPTCVIVLFAPGAGATTVTGEWARGAISGWVSHRTATLAGSGNACIAPDGTIHHVGRFTASSRCARTA
jgi:hypothetical protein